MHNYLETNFQGKGERRIEYVTPCKWKCYKDELGES